MVNKQDTSDQNRGKSRLWSVRQWSRLKPESLFIQRKAMHPTQGPCVVSDATHLSDTKSKTQGQ